MYVHVRAKSRHAEPLSRVALTTRGHTMSTSTTYNTYVHANCTYYCNAHLTDCSISGRVYGILIMLYLSGGLIQWEAIRELLLTSHIINPIPHLTNTTNSYLATGQGWLVGWGTAAVGKCKPGSRVSSQPTSRHSWEVWYAGYARGEERMYM